MQSCFIHVKMDFIALVCVIEYLYHIPESHLICVHGFSVFKWRQINFHLVSFNSIHHDNPLQGSSKPDSLELLFKICKVLFKPYQHISSVLWTGQGLTLLASHWRPESGQRIKVLNVLKTFDAFRKLESLN